jgi:hypothetical protein
VATTFDPKLPEEDEVFSVNFADRLGAGRTVTGATVTATPAGLTVGTPGVSGTVVSVRISGGTAAAVYEVLFLATLDDGEKVGYCIKLKIQGC